MLKREEAFPLLQCKLAEMNQLIEDIYQLSRADVGALVFKQEPVPVAALLENIVEGYQKPAQEIGMTLRLESTLGEDLHIAGDEDRIKQL